MKMWETILVACKANVWRSQMAEAYINFLAGNKIAISAALLQDRKEKYNNKPAQDIVELMQEEWINMNGQYIKTLADLSVETLDSVETILLFDTSMKDNPEIERDFNLQGMNWYEYLQLKYADKIIDADLEDPYQQDLNKSRIIRNEIKKTIKNILNLPHINNITIDIINDPREIQDEEFHKIANVTSDAFWIPMGLQDIKNHIYQNPKVYLSKNNWNIIGFSWVRTYWDFIFRHGTAVHHLFQSIGVYPKMIKTISDDLNRSKFFLRTQNNNVIKSYQKLGFKVMLWEEWLRYMKEHFSDQDLHGIMKDAFEEDLSNITNQWGIFRGVYGGLFGKEGNVDHITSEVYPSFDSLKWDALLVVCVKN